ncbi:anthranilate phosphoribosyltransferase [Candidatus Omnitrophota bacterium]
MIKEAIEIISQKKDLSADAMRAVMEEIMTGKVQLNTIVSFLNALNLKGESVDELTAAVSVMRKHVTKISAEGAVVLDTCGTGGDNLGTFNISTAAALVAAASGITVAKHGNRSVSSRSGSADILEALGVNILIPKEKLEECLVKTGIAFLFAPNLHPSMKYAMPARKKIGKRTMFNILGPLTNPAGAAYQLVGVFDRKWTEPLARVLSNLGAKHAMVVHGADGLDEISTTCATYVSQARDGKIKNYRIDPEELGIKRAAIEDLRGGEAAANADIMLKLLKGMNGPIRDIVVLNAAAAIYVAEKAASIKEGISLAADAIDSGKALKKLKMLKECSNS